MKSFSSSSFASDHTEMLERALAAVNEHPQALFTDFQWFLFQARDTVFFTAFSTMIFDKDKVGNIVEDMLTLAPQLTHGFVGARPGQPFTRQVIDSITHLEMVEDFAGYPDKWLGKSEDIFDRDDLPLFRVQVAVRRGGPDAEGRASIIQVRASHALLEGSDSALITRSQSAAHGIMSDKTRKVAFVPRVLGAIRSQLLSWGFIIVGNLFAGPMKPTGFRTLAIKRSRLRILASRLGVRQRSLYFALVTWAINGEGPKKAWSSRTVNSAYTLLDGERHEADDDFFRVRALQAKFRYSEDFITYVRTVDDTVGRIEAKDITTFQVIVNGMFKTLRGLNRLWSALPGKRMWRYRAGIHVVLTLVPPHRTRGQMSYGMVEPIYCGAWHPAQSIVTFCPGREYVTMNFTIDEHLVDRVPDIEALLARLEATAIAPTDRKVVETEAA